MGVFFDLIHIFPKCYYNILKSIGVTEEEKKKNRASNIIQQKFEKKKRNANTIVYTAPQWTSLLPQTMRKVLNLYHSTVDLLSQIPKDSLKHFEISIPQHIRVERVSKIINWTTTFNKWICNLTPEVRNIYKKNVEKRRNCSLGAISPLFHIILLLVVIVSC